MYRILLVVAIFLSVGRSEAATLLVLGDSISAGYGLADRSRGWVALLGAAIDPQENRVINAGISGDTTAGGLARLPALIRQNSPDVIIIELGANDGLRGINLQEMERNLREMIAVSKKASAIPVLVGMQMPSNFGKRFSERFEVVYHQLAKEMSVPIVPGFLKGVGDVPDLMQPDGIHPGEKAQPLLRDKVLPVIKPLLSSSHNPPNQSGTRKNDRQH